MCGPRCSRCGSPDDPAQLTLAGGLCRSCFQTLRTVAANVACARCGRGRDRADLSLCWSCRNHLGQALPHYEGALRQAIGAGFTPQMESWLRQIQGQLQLADADVGHLQGHVLQARQSPTYVAAWQASIAQQQRASVPQSPAQPAPPQQPSLAEIARARMEEERRRREVERARQREASSAATSEMAARAAQARAEAALVHQERLRREAAEQSVQRKADGIRRFARVFTDVASDGVLQPHEWELLKATARDHGLEWDRALAVVRPKALELLERTITFSADDGVLTDEEESNILQLCFALQLPPADAAVVRQRLFKLKNLLHIRNGGLPLIPDAGMYLDSDETCHLRMDASYVKSGAKRPTATQGRLIATTKKLYFASATGGGTQIPWKSVLGIERHRGLVLLELSQKSGAGGYKVEDPEVTEAILDTIVRMQKRRMLATNPDGPSRRIPHAVRVAVWQRDGGKCVECGATTYLEYDHIIPFSKGGASSVDNVQLLCRKCNCDKADRI